MSRQPPLRRRDRVARTDHAIGAATIALLDGVGYSLLTLNAIARRSERATVTITQRFPTPAHAAAAAWGQHYGAIAVRDLQELLGVAGLLDAPAHEAAFVAGFERFRTPNPDWRTIGELLIVAAFEEPLRAAIHLDLQPAAQRWCTPDPPDVSPTLAAQRAYLLTLAIGLALTGVEAIDHPSDLTLHYRRLLAAFRHPTPPRSTLDLIQAMPLEAEGFDFRTQDPSEHRLFTALLNVVAERGLDRATTRAIADAAGSHQGLLFNRYPSKIGAFLDAITQHQAILMHSQSAAAIALARDHPPAVVDTAIIQRSLLPQRRASRHVGMEYLRSARYHPSIADQIRQTRTAITHQIRAASPDRPANAIDAHVHYGLAVGAGLGVLPLLCPDAHTLPFDVVLEALLMPSPTEAPAPA